ncbi:MAG: zinc ribbon domain-containing protein [Acutalibacteraceae bacterium]|nr:zinc ribbon domain-containing protein [Acutalibacteraceae bacterium]
MEIVDNVVNKAKEIYGVTSEKVGDVIDISKLRVKIAQLDAKNTKDFETLGRMYYESVKDGDMDADEFDAVVEQIDVRNALIKDCKDKIDEQKGIKVCSCGAKNAQDAAFCSTCGQKLD